MLEPQPEPGPEPSSVATPSVDTGGLLELPDEPDLEEPTTGVHQIAPPEVEFDTEEAAPQSPDEPALVEPTPLPEEPPAETATPVAEEQPAETPPESLETATPESEATIGGLDGSSTSVAPPQDLDGPGWAFTRTTGTGGDEARREEARRLARLLVTEIKLYNEDQVEIGRQQGDLYERLKEDIDRSQQIFADRIDPQLAQSEDFFREALVRILAGGDEGALGA